MRPGSAHELSAVERPLALRARPDMEAVPVRFAGRFAYVLKDPLTLELFQLTAEEFFLFEKLQEAHSLKQLQQAMEKHFVPRRFSPQQLQSGINQLHSQGLLVSHATGQGGELLQRTQRRRRSERWQSWLKLLSFRLGSIDATRLVEGLHQRLRWLFSPLALGAMMALFAYAVLIVLGNAGEILDRLPSLGQLAAPRYWTLWLATIVVVKVVHELAHALTCQHFGGRCHEMGVLLLAMIPCLYCDVTDVWRLPSKWQRIAVSAAGMLAELVIASLALVVWWHAQPGLLQIVCLSVVIVCSVGTLLVNLNPLLRYDGYYILSDWVEVPNLAGRAQGLLPTALRRWLLAEPRPPETMLSSRRQQGLWFYAIAARVYLTLVLLGIFGMLLTWARPYRLENSVYTLGVITLAGMLYSPLWGVWRLLRNPAQRYRLQRPRLALLGSSAIALLLAFFLWPISRSVSGPAVFVPAQAHPLYATAAGELQFALPPGTQVRAGEVVVRLVDPETELAVARQQGEYSVRQVHFEQLSALRAWSERSSEQLPTAQAAVSDAAAQLKQWQAKVEELTIKTPTAGVLVAPPSIEPHEHDERRLPGWSGSPLESRNRGCWIEPGTVLGLVARDEQLEALVMIDQDDVAEVQPGQPVRLLLESSPVRVVLGEVVQVARRSEERATTDPTVQAGKHHLVQVRLEPSDALLLVGSRGTAKIMASSSTLSAIVAHQLSELLRLPW